MNRSLPRAGRRVRIAVLLALVALSGCSGGKHAQTSAPVAAPASVIDAVTLDADRLALLAGGGDARTVHVERIADGKEEKLFGVTGGANAIARAGNEYLIGISDADATVGALERWSLDGHKLASYPLPGGVKSIATFGSHADVLIGNHDVSALVRFDLNAHRVEPKTLPLPVGTARIAPCAVGKTTLLAAAGGPQHRLYVIDPESGERHDSSTSADSPVCSGTSMYALLNVGANDEHQIVVLALPALLQTEAVSTSGDAAILLLAGTKLVEINSDPRASALRTIDLATGALGS